MNTSRTTIIAALAYLTSLIIISLVLSGEARASLPVDQTATHNNSRSINTIALAKLYPDDKHYLWLDKDNELTTRAYYALEFIADSASHGLNPDDYHYLLLQQLDPELDGDDAYLFDLMLSDGLLKLIKDMYIGRLNPALVDPKWSIPRKSFDAVEYLKFAFSTDHFRACLYSLIPDSPQYQALLAAAQRYQSYAAENNWQKIPATPILHVGDQHESVGAIRHRLTAEGYINEALGEEKVNYYDPQLAKSVREFQRQHSLNDDAVIGPATIREMNVSAAERLQHIYINLERLRWLPDELGKRYIMVNLANYRLTAIEDNDIKLDMRVIVGKNKRSTPSFSSKITHIILNPKWYVPKKLATKDLLPKQQKRADYFERFNFRVYKNENGKKVEINPDTVDWKTVSSQHFPYTLVQDSGRKNALGTMKFIVPNPWSIYLHDTPSKGLFNQEKRTFSSGCIRVEDPLALADFSLGHSRQTLPITELIKSEERHSTKLDQPVSVYAVYATVWQDGENVVFSPDNYGRDKRMARYLPTTTEATVRHIAQNI